MTFSNPLLDAWAQGRTTLGVWCTMPGSVSAEFIARQQVDYVCVDQQHGLIDHSTAIPMIQAIAAGGSTPITRARWNEAPSIMAVLDAGSLGVVVPMVNDAAEARRAVQACRYPPAGIRSYGPVRASYVAGSADPDDLARVACIVMVETAEGIKNVGEIAATDGVDAIYIGPSDLALAMGLHPRHSPPNPEFLQVIADIRAACADHGVAAGIQAPNGETAKTWVEQGFNMVTIGSDAALLAASVQTHLEVARGAVAEGDRVQATGTY